MTEVVETGLFGPHLELCHTSRDFEDYHAPAAAFEVQTFPFGLLRDCKVLFPRRVLTD
jgi:hypothetical protein